MGSGTIVGLDINSFDSSLFADFEAIYSPLSAELEGPETLAEAIAFLAEASPEAEERRVHHCVLKYFYSLEVARLAARHPSCPDSLMLYFYKFLPEEVAHNPALERAKASKYWQLHGPDGSRRSPNARMIINDERPFLVSVLYWMKHGSNAGKRTMAAIEPMYDFVLERFMKEKSAPLRKVIASRACIPAPILEALASDSAKTVRAALAANENLAPDTLLSMAGDSEESVREALLANPACPEEARHQIHISKAAQPTPHLGKLSKLKTGDLIALLGSEETAAERLSEIAAMEPPYLRAGCALHRNTAPTLLGELAADPDLMVRESAAMNPNTPQASLETLLAAGEPRILQALASNSDLSEALQISLADMADEPLGRMLADTTDSVAVWQHLSEGMVVNKGKIRNSWHENLKALLDPETNSNKLESLQRGRNHRWLHIHKMVSRHPKCPQHLWGHYACYLFDSLAQNPVVTLKLLENPNAITPEPYAEWKVEDWLANGNAPGHVANYFLTSDDIARRRKAITSLTARPALLLPLVFVDDIHSRKRLAQDERTTQFMQEILARDAKLPVRELIAKNKSAMAPVLSTLAVDKAPSVAAAAVQNNNYKTAAGNGSKASEQKPVDTPSYANRGQKRDRVRMAKQAHDPVILADLACDRDESVRFYVAINKHTNRETVLALLQDPSALVRDGAAGNKHILPEELRPLFEDESAKVRRTALVKSFWPTATVDRKQDRAVIDGDESLLEPFYEDKDADVLQALARYSGNPAIHQRLALHEETKVRDALASNVRIDLAVSQRLMADSIQRVVSTLARHTPHPEVLQELLTHNPALINSRDFNPHLLSEPRLNAWLCRHPDEKVRRAGAHHCTSPDELLRLAADNSRKVREAVAYREGIGLDVAEVLLHRPSEEMVWHLMGKKYLVEVCGEAMERWLKEDNIGFVRTAAELLPLTEAQQRTLLASGNEDILAGMRYNQNTKWLPDVRLQLESSANR